VLASAEQRCQVGLACASTCAASSVGVVMSTACTHSVAPAEASLRSARISSVISICNAGRSLSYFDMQRVTLIVLF
jgi:hypothetical protein